MTTDNQIEEPNHQPTFLEGGVKFLTKHMQIKNKFKQLNAKINIFYNSRQEAKMM